MFLRLRPLVAGALIVPLALTLMGADACEAHPGDGVHPGNPCVVAMGPASAPSLLSKPTCTSHPQATIPTTEQPKLPPPPKPPTSVEPRVRRKVVLKVDWRLPKGVRVSYWIGRRANVPAEVARESDANRRYPPDKGALDAFVGEEVIVLVEANEGEFDGTTHCVIDEVLSGGATRNRDDQRNNIGPAESRCEWKVE